MDAVREELQQLIAKITGQIGQFGFQLIVAVLVWAVGRRIIKWLVNKVLATFLEKTSLEKDVYHFILSLARIVLYIMLILEILTVVGIQTTSMLTMLGTAVLAVGMSLQGSLSNFAGGLILLIFKPFRVGDYVESQTCEGNVEAIGILYTKIITIDQKTIFMPNGALMNSNITNYSATGIRRLDIEIGVPYDTDLKLVRRIMLDVLAEDDRVIKDKDQEVVLKKLGDSAIVMESHAYVYRSDFLSSKFSITEKYFEALKEHGISIPFPQMDVHMDQNQD